MSHKLSIYAGLAGLAVAVTSCVLDANGSPSDPEVSSVDQASVHEACPANVPAALAPALDADLAFDLAAQGVQRYSCVASTTGYTWTFIAPDADLFERNPHHLSVHHFAGPSWVYKDSSSVVGAKVAGATVDPTAIPWLLLDVTRHGGEDGKLTGITQIQRLVTTGGLAPATGCDADHVGAEADVLYTARYFFYRTSTNAHRTRCGG